MAHPDANKPVPARLANQGFVRDLDTGQLVRTDAARQDAIREGGISNLPVRRPPPMNISHEQLIEAAVSELNAKETLLGFWDFIREMSLTARANPEKYSGEMARPEKWTKGFVERWLSQNIIEIWRRTHILGKQLDIEEWKDHFWSKRDNFAEVSEDMDYAEVGPRRSGVPIRTAIKRKKPRIVKPPLTRKARVIKAAGGTQPGKRGAAIRKGVRAQQKASLAGRRAIRKGKGAISTIATKARAGAGAAWKRRRGLTQGARRIATRRFADAINEWSYADNSTMEFHPRKRKLTKKEKLAGLAGMAAPLAGLALLGKGRGLKGKLSKRQGTARGSRLRRRTESRKKSIHGSGQGPGMNYLKKRSYLSEDLEDNMNEWNYVAKDEEKKKMSKKKKVALGIGAGLVGAAGVGEVLLRKKFLGKGRGPRFRSMAKQRIKSGKKGPGFNPYKKRSYLSEESDQLHEYFLGIAGSLAAGVAGSVLGGALGKKKKKKNGQAIPY